MCLRAKADSTASPLLALHLCGRVSVASTMLARFPWPPPLLARFCGLPLLVAHIPWPPPLLARFPWPSPMLARFFQGLCPDFICLILHNTDPYTPSPRNNVHSSSLHTKSVRAASFVLQLPSWWRLCQPEPPAPCTPGQSQRRPKAARSSAGARQ